MHRISEYPRAARLVRRFPQILGQIVAVENIVAQNQRAWTGSEKFCSHEKSLRNSLRLRLHEILQLNAELASVSQQGLETWERLPALR